MDQILARKNLEQEQCGGLFYWGIGSSVGPALLALLAAVERPEVLFSPIKSAPRAIDVSPVHVVLGLIIAEEPQVDEICCQREELERREIALVECACVRPDPANPMFLQKMNDLRPVPCRVPELDSEAEIVRQLTEKFA